MTATKATAGAVAGWLVTIAVWLLTRIPGWESVPLEPQAALIGLVTAGIGYGTVYFAPSNKATVDEP